MLILAAILAIFIYGMIASTLGTILPCLSTQFMLTPNQNGRIALAQAVGLILASLAVGPILDSEGKKFGLLLGLSLTVLTLTLLPRAGGYRTILLLLFMLGTGGGVLITSANALASDVGGSHRAVVMNLVNLFFGLGGFITPFIAANLFRGNWIRLCNAIAVFTGVTLLFEVATNLPVPSGIITPSFAGVGALLQQPSLLLLGLFLFLYVSCEVGIWNWLPRHLIAQGIPESRALNILSLGFALGLLCGRLLISQVLVHIAAITVLFWASAVMAVTTFLILRTRDTGIAMALVALSGMAMAPVFPTTLAVVGGHFPAATGTAIGIAITFGWIGLAVSSTIIGAITGEDARNLRKALLVIPAAAIVMTTLSIMLRVRYHP